MAEAAPQSALQKMARRGRSRPVPDRGAGARRAFQRALRRAGAPFPGLLPEPEGDEVQWALLLGDLLTSLPDGGLVVGLDAPHGQRGLCLLDQPLVDALIEVQTTGRVDSGPGAARPFTKIDIALTRDFIDLLLSAFSAELEGVMGVDWPRRMSFGGPIPDRRQLPLLMPDATYHLFQVDLSLGDGAKTGAARLVVPGGSGSAAVDQAASQSVEDPAWKAAFFRAIARVEVPLDVVLTRDRRSIAALEALTPGDLICFDAEDMGQATLVDQAGNTVLKGRLGRQMGKRALRLTTGIRPERVASSAAASSAAASPPGDPMAAASPADLGAADPVPAAPDTVAAEALDAAAPPSISHDNPTAPPPTPMV